MVICLDRGADLHMAQLMPLPLTVSCFSKIQIGFTFLVRAHPGSPGQRAVKRVCVYVCVLLAISILYPFLCCWHAHPYNSLVLWHIRKLSQLLLRLPIGKQSIAMIVSVCLSTSISLELRFQSSPNFCACYLCPLLLCSLAALQYIM